HAPRLLRWTLSRSMRETITNSVSNIITTNGMMNAVFIDFTIRRNLSDGGDIIHRRPSNARIDYGSYFLVITGFRRSGYKVRHSSQTVPSQPLALQNSLP